jgi:multimeric flavodoxin WrbA
MPNPDIAASAVDPPRFSYGDLTALYLNTTLKRSPAVSNTQGLIDTSAGILRKHGVRVDVIRSVDFPIASGVYPDMREHGWQTDAWPELTARVLSADILVLAGPIWLGEQSSEARKVIERLYALNSEVRDDGQYLFTGKVGGALVSGNEDGVKHVSASWLWSLAHMGFTIPANADAGWIGPIGPGPSYLNPESDGPRTDFTNRSVTFLSWNLMHAAALLKRSDGYPRWGNLPNAWAEGERFDFEPYAGPATDD